MSAPVEEVVRALVVLATAGAAAGATLRARRLMHAEPVMAVVESCRSLGGRRWVTSVRYRDATGTECVGTFGGRHEVGARLKIRYTDLLQRRTVTAERLFWPYAEAVCTLVAGAATLAVTFLT